VSCLEPVWKRSALREFPKLFDSSAFALPDGSTWRDQLLLAVANNKARIQRTVSKAQVPAAKKPRTKLSKITELSGARAQQQRRPLM